jgi:hypothetical protein
MHGKKYLEATNAFYYLFFLTNMLFFFVFVPKIARFMPSMAGMNFAKVLGTNAHKDIENMVSK